MYISREPHKDLKLNTLVEKLTTEQLSKYTHVDVHRVPQTFLDKRFNIALVIRSPRHILKNREDKYIKYIPVECLRVVEDTDNFTNNYPNMMSLVAREILEVYEVPRENVTPHTSFPNIRGVISTDNSFNVVIELFVVAPIFDKKDSDRFEDLTEVKSTFTSDDILDTIILDSLKVVM